MSTVSEKMLLGIQQCSDFYTSLYTEAEGGVRGGMGVRYHVEEGGNGSGVDKEGDEED